MIPEQQVCIQRIVNFPVDSNCYLVTHKNSPECIVVDPSLEDPSFFFHDISSKGLVLKYIILTHEHFDHIRSVEFLRESSGCKVVASKACSENITNPKGNLSLFHDQVGFACSPSDIVVDKSGYNLPWTSEVLNFYLTPGHSNGSLCFSIGNHWLFTGDTIIKDNKTIVKLPGGSTEKLIASLNMLVTLFDGGTTIYPGHGEVFEFSEINIDSLIAR